VDLGALQFVELEMVEEKKEEVEMEEVEEVMEEEEVEEVEVALMRRMIRTKRRYD
jgi:FAD synthase